jgi:PKD repeat protein
VLGFAYFICISNSAAAQLKAEFTSNIQTGCPPLIVAFQDQSTGNPTSWKWTLGNGATSILQNPVTTYFDPGVYTVKLVIKSSAGADSITKVSYITVFSNPQASFSASPTQGCYPLHVDFTDNSKAGSGTIAGYLWDFGDGNISTESKPTHVYTAGGTFDITLKVTNSLGCWNAITKSDLVHINDGVNAGFELTSLDVCKTPATASFKNTSAGSGTLEYNWDFGDGTTSAWPRQRIDITRQEHTR